MAPDLMRLKDVAEFLGVSEEHARELAARADFPSPLRTVFAGRIWRRGDVDRWARDMRAAYGRR
jgi:predicted DNA-binding transcriptional regulator AlpA